MAISADYRSRHYLDKDDPTREAIDIMTAIIPIESATSRRSRPSRARKPKSYP